MVIWLHGRAGDAGVEDGIVPAAFVGEVAAFDQLRHVLDDRRDQILQAAHAEAQALLQQARQEAMHVREQASIEAERVRLEAYEAGHRQAALEWHEQQTGQVIDKAQMLHNMHEKLATIVTAAVERIVHTEQRGALYQRALRSVQGLAQGASTLALRVNEADYEHARAAIESLQALQAHGLRIEVSVDPALKPGGCVFESEVGILDASLQTQLDGLRAAMDRAVRKALTDDDAPGQSSSADLPPPIPVSTHAGFVEDDGVDEDPLDEGVHDSALES